MPFQPIVVHQHCALLPIKNKLQLQQFCPLQCMKRLIRSDAGHWVTVQASVISQFVHASVMDPEGKIMSAK